MSVSKTQITNQFGTESIRFHTEGSTISRVDFSIGIISFLDKDTKMYVTYAPSLEVSGYGVNGEDALSMCKASIDESIEMLGKLPAKKAKEDLEKLGWKQNWIRHKNFSRSYVDVDGVLRGFNADPETIQKATLVTA